jgi:hypothetical protein
MCSEHQFGTPVREDAMAVDAQGLVWITSPLVAAALLMVATALVALSRLDPGASAPRSRANARGCRSPLAPAPAVAGARPAPLLRRHTRRARQPRQASSGCRGGGRGAQVLAR